MKKIISLILALVMVLSLSTFVFTSCGSNEAKSNAGEETSETDTAQKLNQTVLKMATNAHFQPYEYTDDNGNVIGIDAEIAALIAAKLGMNLEILDMEFESTLPAVISGSADMVMAGLTVTEERKASVNFTDSYAKGVQVIIVKEDSSITGPDDLKDKTIGVQTSTTGDQYCTSDFGADHVKPFTFGAAAVAALVNGQVDCVVIDNEPAKAFVAANAGLKILDTAYTEEDYAIAVNKENTVLLDAINNALKELKAEGKIDEVLNKYIKAE